MVPFRTDKNLGRAYNEAMGLIPEGDWAVFLDHDAMFTTPKWHAQITEAIEAFPDAGAFVGCTNRIASPWQRVGGNDRTHDIAWHRKLGAERAKLRTLLDISQTKGWGGVCFAVSKAAWLAVGPFADGLGCVDHSLHFALQRAGKPVYMIEALYLFHWRHFGEPDPTSSAPKAPDCPCRGPEIEPTVRVTLPPC